jgi:uncharacterized membrane protein
MKTKRGIFYGTSIILPGLNGWYNNKYPRIFYTGSSSPITNLVLRESVTVQQQALVATKILFFFSLRRILLLTTTMHWVGCNGLVRDSPSVLPSHPTMGIPTNLPSR